MKRLAPAIGVVLVLGSLALLVLLVLPEDVSRPESASSDAGPRVPPVVSPEARRLLERAAAAPMTTAYSGTQFAAAWSAGSTASRLIDVEHRPETGTHWAPAGRAEPGRSVVRTAAYSAEPSLLEIGAVSLMARHYSLAVAPAGRVAGREADIVEAYRPTTGTGTGADARLVARFWLDRATGLVLRREVYDGRGRAIRASAFVDVEVESDIRPQAEPESDEGKAWSTTLDRATVTRMRRHGWDCPDTLPGPLPLVDARRGGADRDIVHLSYADGIASISVFEQRGELDLDRLDGYQRSTVAGRTVWAREEVPRRLVWSRGDTVFTLVADDPERTVNQAVGVLHAGPGSGQEDPVDRLGRGLDRVGSWFNPFE